MIRVVVNGADGRMGSEVVKAVTADAELALVGGVSLTHVGEDIGVAAGMQALGISMGNNLAAVLDTCHPEVAVDFTTPDAIYENAEICLTKGVHMVVGTTGLTAVQRERLGKLAAANGVGLFIAPNFSIGAVLMMRFAAEAALYLPNVEIIELHHNNKLDAPSGTAILTAERVAAARKQAGAAAAPDHTQESLRGARGATVEDIPVHSVRLPGYVAHQQVLFGGQGELLTLRHDSLDRKSFMPGVLLAIKKVSGHTGLTFGLEHYL